MKDWSLRTTLAYIISLLMLLFGYIWGTFYTEAPYEYLVFGITGLFGVNSAKRHKDKKIGVFKEYD